MAKKKKKDNTSDVPMKPWEMERMMADMQKMLEQQNFESIEEANAFLSQFVGKKLPPLNPDDPVSLAQEMVYNAYEAETLDGAIGKAKQALKIDPNCADAYLILAETAMEPDEMIGYFEQAVAAGRRAIRSY